jgi:predicted ester cyclase
MGIETEAGPLAVYRAWQRSLATGDMAQVGAVVDLAGYRDICLGLTGETTGYEVALANYLRNMVAPWADMTSTEVEVVEGSEAVTVHSRVEATHVGEFLGVAPTGRRIAWDNVSIVRVRGGRVIGQWAQPDLWGIHRQLTAPAG